MTKALLTATCLAILFTAGYFVMADRSDRERASAAAASAARIRACNAALKSYQTGVRNTADISVSECVVQGILAPDALGD